MGPTGWVGGWVGGGTGRVRAGVKFDRGNWSGELHPVVHRVKGILEAKAKMRGLFFLGLLESSNEMD